jgi:hypothetical protein
MDDIRILGRWGKDVCLQHYMTNIPRGAVLALAGHGADDHSYYLPRGELDPPEELLKLVMPWVEGELEKARIVRLRVRLCIVWWVCCSNVMYWRSATARAALLWTLQPLVTCRSFCGTRWSSYRFECIAQLSVRP